MNIFNNYDPPVKAAIVFLKLLNVKVNKTTVNNTLQNHPDWPSLLCLSDSFTKWQIPNGAGKVEPAGIDSLPLPFIAYTKDDIESPFTVITQVTDSTISYYAKDYSRLKTEDKKTFLRKWTGVYLIAEVNEYSGEAGYNAVKWKQFGKSLIPLFLLILVLSLSTLALQSSISSSGWNSSNWGIYLQYLVSLAGVTVTSLLLWYEVDQGNRVLAKVCSGITRGNCNAILSSPQAKLFKWLSWSEVGFFYFTGGFLSLLFAGPYLPNVLGIVSWLNILALPYVVFSIYFQGFVARLWCVLCLCIQALLVLGAIVSLSNHSLIPFSSLAGVFLVKTALLYILPPLCWYSAKPFLLRLQEAKHIKRQYLRIKFNTEIFETLLKKQKLINEGVAGLGIKLGNPAARNTLLKVCNPYCGPCGKAHPTLESLLEKNSNLRAQIIFTTPNRPDDRAYKPVSHLLAIQETAKSEETIKKALDDWYLSPKKDYDTFASKYPLNGELAKQGSKIESMDTWCKQMKVVFTPTFFLNGYQLPEAYSVDDLQYFLQE
ncbi:vitamin K epoxide reductase family protein [Puia dinghuensis]|uniref:Vitamin K epoxide reductase domain-containing protein n=1 Tax=Puia dinghuensis TaxID=1792502 RepID=A0A8J2XUG9_9BACT|nr:vitamin K epoxide reductase family protein [Puia dinghuensis]GGB11615.1 hypothetical protein GCM10011511_39060 [Puia dinghuensis]